MSRKEEFYFESRDQKTKIHAVRWIPESGNIRAILQISHGMVEYIERYEEFADYLTERGFLVTGNDHLGHGDSVGSKEDWGFFAEKNGNSIVVRDIHRLKKITEEKYPNIPYFLLGHSMGSFMVRQYLLYYGRGIDGAIIMGTGKKPEKTVKFGLFMVHFLALFKGWHFRSKFIDRQSFGSYNKSFQPARTKCDWLSRDERKVDEYLAEPRCTFLFTLAGYKDLFTALKVLADTKNLQKMPKNLPVFFVAGDKDPVGAYGEGVKSVYQDFLDAGMKDVSIKLYKDDRHEILNELDRQTVYEDIYQWLNQKMPNEN
jgi:alpha-beta hydrolase superfamily lysophospholipase